MVNKQYLTFNFKVNPGDNLGIDLHLIDLKDQLRYISFDRMDCVGYFASPDTKEDVETKIEPLVSPIIQPEQEISVPVIGKALVLGIYDNVHHPHDLINITLEVPEGKYDFKMAYECLLSSNQTSNLIDFLGEKLIGCKRTTHREDPEKGPINRVLRSKGFELEYNFDHLGSMQKLEGSLNDPYDVLVVYDNCCFAKNDFFLSHQFCMFLSGGFDEIYGGTETKSIIEEVFAGDSNRANRLIETYKDVPKILFGNLVFPNGSITQKSLKNKWISAFIPFEDDFEERLEEVVNRLS